MKAEPYKIIQLLLRLYPIDIGRRFYVYKTTTRRLIDVETMSCVYWVWRQSLCCTTNFLPIQILKLSAIIGNVAARMYLLGDYLRYGYFFPFSLFFLFNHLWCIHEACDKGTNILTIITTFGTKYSRMD